MACCKASDCATRITALGTSAQLFETAGFNKEQMLELFHGTSTQVIEGVVKNMPTLEKAGFTPAKIIESKNVLANIISLAEELHSIREPSISGTVPADSLKKQHR
jgi:hypothetical protein